MDLFHFSVVFFISRHSVIQLSTASPEHWLHPLICRKPTKQISFISISDTLDLESLWGFKSVTCHCFCYILLMRLISFGCLLIFDSGLILEFCWVCGSPGRWDWGCLSMSSLAFTLPEQQWSGEMYRVPALAVSAATL